MTQFKFPAAHPPVITILEELCIATLSCNYKLNGGDSDYKLYTNRRFGPIPPEGDLTGLVSQVVTLARVANSGVESITVRPLEIVLVVTRASEGTGGELLRRAALLAGLGRVQVK